jgi:hypothetical protein
MIPVAIVTSVSENAAQRRGRALPGCGLIVSR